MRRAGLMVGALVWSASMAGVSLAQDAGTGDVAAGRRVAAGVCQACHGLNGLAKMPEMPTIAGADAGYLLKQLEAYKSGQRQNELMATVAPMLDDKKMADVAAYYAAVQVTATPP